MQLNRGRKRDERGETLVEVIVAIAILNLAAVAILGGVVLAVKASDFNRKEANSGSAVRSAAEKIQNYVAAASGNYKNCAAADAYLAPSGVSAVSGYTPSQAKAESWNGTTWTTCSADNGVQRVKLTVSVAGDAQHSAVTETLYVVLRKACSGTLPTPCS